MCAVIVAAIAVLAVLGLVIEYWPVTLAILGGWLVIQAVRAHGEREAEWQAQERARVISEHQAALEFWTAQLSQLDTPAARKTAEDLVDFNRARLRELGVTG